jgi:hypothetical protein
MINTACPVFATNLQHGQPAATLCRGLLLRLAGDGAPRDKEGHAIVVSDISLCAGLDLLNPCLAPAGHAGYLSVGQPGPLQVHQQP